RKNRVRSRRRKLGHAPARPRALPLSRSRRSRYGSSVASAQPPAATNGETDGRAVVHTLRMPRSKPADASGERRSLQCLLDEAAEQISRFSALEAFSASAADGVIIDIRSQSAREQHGVIPGSLHIPRTVLEW